jgi:hypothetical protein
MPDRAPRPGTTDALHRHGTRSDHAGLRRIRASSGTGRLEGGSCAAGLRCGFKQRLPRRSFDNLGAPSVWSFCPEPHAGTGKRGHLPKFKVQGVVIGFHEDLAEGRGWDWLAGWFGAGRGKKFLPLLSPVCTFTGIQFSLGAVRPFPSAPTHFTRFTCCRHLANRFLGASSKKEEAKAYRRQAAP